MILSPPNTYTGATTVTGVTLPLTGTLANNGSDRVFVPADGAPFAGAGNPTIDGALDGGDAISAIEAMIDSLVGNGSGTLLVAGPSTHDSAINIGADTANLVPCSGGPITHPGGIGGGPLVKGSMDAAIRPDCRTYPYMEEVNDGILRQFRRMQPANGLGLDVGCGRGALGEAIRELGWEVWGIEQNQEACATAQNRLDRLISADLLDRGSMDRQIGDVRFDAVVFSDVLEHLYDPLTVLENYLPYLKPQGKLLISVPNAAVWTNRLNWILGRVNYTDTGVMDRTHIRFFTFRTARQLVEATGCRVVKIDFTPHLVRAALRLVKRLLAGIRAAENPNPRALIESRGYQLYMRCAYPIERVFASLWKSMFAFRIIVVAVKQ